MLERRTFPALAAMVAAVAALLASAALVAQASAGAGVTTAGYGTLRDDWDPNEPALSPSAVHSGGFGKLFTASLEGSIYAQPLVYEGDVIVTTEKANAYAINATNGSIVWKRSFGSPFKASTIGCSDLKPDLGSTSTPVIDPSTGTVYLTTRLETKGGLENAHWYLQAMSASTGEERPGFPVAIAGTPINTPGVPFNESYEQQRPGLLLLNGVVYIAFASDCDITPYRGIVVGVSASTGAITTMWSDEAGVGTGESSQAGIWQSGAGLVSDIPGRIILTSGNGVSPQPATSSEPPATLSESVIGLTVDPSGQLTPSQFFAPSNAPDPRRRTTKISARAGRSRCRREYFGTKSIPHLVVQVGKDGRIFLVNADDMGGYRRVPGAATRSCRPSARSPASGATPLHTAARAAGCTCSRAPAAATCTRSATGSTAKACPRSAHWRRARKASATHPAHRSSRATARPPAAPSCGWSTPTAPPAATVSCAPTRLPPSAATCRCCGPARSALRPSSRRRPPTKGASI